MTASAQQGTLASRCLHPRLHASRRAGSSGPIMTNAIGIRCNFETSKTDLIDLDGSRAQSIGTIPSGGGAGAAPGRGSMQGRHRRLLGVAPAAGCDCSGAVVCGSVLLEWCRQAYACASSRAHASGRGLMSEYVAQVLVTSSCAQPVSMAQQHRTCCSSAAGRRVTEECSGIDKHSKRSSSESIGFKTAASDY